MAITGPASYLSTTDEFLSHWLSADTTLGVGNELTLPSAVARADLQTRRDDLGARVLDVQMKLTALEVARGDIEIRKEGLLLRLNQFNEKMRALHENSKWARALPLVPGIGEGPSNFATPLDAANSVWQLINADAAVTDVTLLGGYTQATFATDIVALKTAFTAYNTAAAVLSVTREERNDLQDAIYDILRKYRQTLPTAFAKNHALVDSLPRLSPEPGSTPDAVTATSVWDVALSSAKLTWTASADTNLSEYEIRFCAGPNYSTDNESAIGSVSPTAPREFLTNTGLSAPGNVATFKVYVITTTGNEKGSNTVAVTRPAG